MSSFPCKIIEADLDADIVTLQMEGDYTVSAGQKYLCDAAAASAEPVAAPKGWRLVPVSPTKEMLLAGETDEYDTAIWWDLMLAAAPAAPVTVQPDLTQQDATLHAEVLDMVRMLEANEWADHCGKSELGQRLEWAITALQNQPQNIPEIIPESAKLDAETGKSVLVGNQGVMKHDAEKVQADLLSSLVEIVDAVIASDEEGLIEHSETIIKARAAIDAARKEAAHG
ncbi:hypothetical protein [Alcaligenes aquatilis]|uniref:hypothetical protein n=1 Tax=Alcaligenes aquatilis TaxID=323284 RepID=UPI003D1B85EB